jgi:hypothetical protein
MYRKIRLPLLFKILNSAGRTFRVPVPINPDILIKKARKKTGLYDFGDDSFYLPLSKLIESAKKEADLTPLGWLVLKIRLVTILCNNLRTRQILKTHPGILDIPLAPPIFISGIQRTGTTFLQRIMASDTRARPLYFWEGLHPVPHIRLDGRKKRITESRLKEDINSRIKKAKITASALHMLSPGYYAIHPVEYKGPEEDVLLLDHSFISTVAEAVMHVPSFSHWLEKQDQGPAYEKMRVLLQVLQWQCKSSHWILKTPHHLEWFEYLFKIFPDAKIIMTHRDPITAIASFSSMIHHSWSIFSDSADPVKAGGHWFRKVKRMIRRAMEFRKNNDKRFYDVSYYDLVADPLETVRRIYAFLDIPFDAETMRNMKKTISTHKKNRFGKHIYSLKDYGIDVDEAESAFADYRKRFSIAREYTEKTGERYI